MAIQLLSRRENNTFEQFNTPLDDMVCVIFFQAMGDIGHWNNGIPDITWGAFLSYNGEEVNTFSLC